MLASPGGGGWDTSRACCAAPLPATHSRSNRPSCKGDKRIDQLLVASSHMFPVEVSALAAGGAGAGRQAAGDAAGTMLPPFFMGSIWPAAAGSEEDEAAAAAAAHDRALAASRNHREAEKRRRERIKSHLDRLRNVLACDPKAYILRLSPRICQLLIY